MATRIRAILEATDRASPTFAKVHGAAVALGAAAAAVGAYQIGRTLVAGLESAVKAAADAERSQAQLGQALKNLGGDATGALGHLRQYAAQLQRQTGIDDDLILKNQALLVSIGKLSGEGLDRATRAAIDFAAATDRDIGTAFELIAKAAAGSTEQLKRYGIVLDDSIPKARRFQEALLLIERQFGGAAAANLDTYQGQVEALTGEFENLKEEIGESLIPVVREFVETFLRPLVQDMTGAAAGTKTMASAVRTLAHDMVGLLGPIEIAARNLKALTEASDAIQRLGSGRSQLIDISREGIKFGEVFKDAAEVWRLFTRELDYSTPRTDALRESLSDMAAIMSVGMKRVSDFRNYIAKPAAPDPFAGIGDLAGQIEREVDAAGALAELIDAINSFSFDIKPLKVERIFDAQGIGDVGAMIEAEIAKRLERVVTLQDAAWRIGTVGAERFRAELEKTGFVVEDLGAAMDRELRQFGVSTAFAIGDAFVDAFTRAEFSWSQFARQILIDLAKIINQMFIANLISGVATSAVGASRATYGIAGGAYAPSDSILLGGATQSLTSSALAQSGLTSVSTQPPVVVNQRVTIDARGADPSAVGRIEQALARHRDETVRAAAAAVANRVARGGRYAVTFRGRA